MRNVKAILALGLAAVIGVTATGCGKKAAAADDSAKDTKKKITITAATGGSPKPYIYVDENNNPTGYDIEVLKAAFEKLPQYDLEFQVTDFGSVFSGLNSGTVQIGVNNFSYNEERGKSYLYSYPYDKIGYVFVTKEGSTPITSFKEAAGKTTEASTGVSITNALEEWNKEYPDQAVQITYSESDTAVKLQKIACK